MEYFEGMRLLHLPLKAKWYDMIESGKKTEEYRAITEYWKKRLEKRNYTHVCFRYGYTRRTMTYPIQEITIGKGNPEWGAPQEDVFIIKFTNSVKIYEINIWQ